MSGRGRDLSGSATDRLEEGEGVYTRTHVRPIKSPKLPQKQKTEVKPEENSITRQRYIYFVRQSSIETRWNDNKCRIGKR